MVIRIFRAAFWAAAALSFIMAILPQPPAVPAQDKLQHMAAFLTLAVLGALGYPRLPPIKLTILLALFGGLIELAQLIPALHRDGEVLDWMADIAAAAAGLFAVALWRRLAGSNRDA
jgi:VanZ family protein